MRSLSENKMELDTNVSYSVEVSEDKCPMIKEFFENIDSSHEGKIPKWRMAINKLIKRTGSLVQLSHPLDYGDMMNPECKINLYHLLSSLKHLNVTGDLVDIGCFDGKNSAFMGLLMAELGIDAHFYLYDHFGKGYGRNVSKQTVMDSFKKFNLRQPTLYENDFRVSIPKDLPDTISFAHIDCGHGGDKNEHADIIVFLLEHIYPRLEKNAVVIMMDYTQGVRKSVWNVNPGVKIGCDRFFANKPEKITELYGGFFAQGFFRKQ